MHLRAVAEAEGDALTGDVGDFAIAAVEPALHGPAFGEAGLDTVDGEPAAFGEEAQDAMAQQGELADEVVVLADRDHSRVAGDLPQRFEVGQVGARVQGGEHGLLVANELVETGG